jgi:phage I-like protein
MARALRLDTYRAISNGALSGDQLPTRIKVLDWGRNKTLKGDVLVDEKTAQVFDANQKQIGRESAPLDWNHCTVEGTSAFKALKGRAPQIFAYGTLKVIPGDGIWYEVTEWTPCANDPQTGARNFKDLSPTPWLDEDGRVLGIHSVALTPAGAVEDLTFYSAFDDLAAFTPAILHAASEGSPVSSLALKTFSIDPYLGNNPYGNGLPLLQQQEHSMKQCYDIFRAGFKMDPKSSDEDVKKKVLSIFAASPGLADMKADEMAKHLSAMFAESNPDPNNRPFMNHMPEEIAKAGTPPLSAEVEKLVAAALAPLSAKIVALETHGAAQIKAAEKAEKAALVAQCGAEKKIIPLSAEEIDAIPLTIFKGMVGKLVPNSVPTTRKALKPVGADGKDGSGKPLVVLNADGSIKGGGTSLKESAKAFEDAMALAEGRVLVQ